MKIIRDGKEIELTAEELRAAYEEKHHEHFVEDVQSSIDGMGIDKELDASDCKELAWRFDKALGRNDSYWDSYWCTLENVIAEYFEEGE